MTDRPGSFFRIPSIVLAVVLALAAAGACPAVAQEGPPVPASPEAAPHVGPPVPASPEPTPSEKFVEEKASGVMMAVDESHASIERGILDRVIRFDNFFGTVKGDEARHPDFLLRWVNSLRVEEGGRFKYRASGRASLVLPKISNRLRLVVSGETEPEPFSAKLPEDPGNPGFDRTLPNTRLANTEVRYSLIRKPSVDLFLGTGVRIKSPLETFARSRFQYSLRLGDVTLARFAETVFWKNIEGFGETTELELSRQLSRKTLLRWASAGTVTEEGLGVEWATELSLLRELSPRSAITFGGGLSGHTRPEDTVDIYRIFTRYRRNFLRTWLFFELEPEISWPRDPVGEYPLTYASTFRIEVVFLGTSAMMKKHPGIK